MTLKVTTETYPTESHVIEERWEIRPVYNLFRTGMTVVGSGVEHGSKEFFIGSFESEEAALGNITNDDVFGTPRKIIDRSDA